MVLSIHIGCMQGSKLYLACQPAHKAASRSISKAMYLSTLLWGFFCRKTTACRSSDSDRHGHWEPSARGLRGLLYRLCYRYMLYFSPSVLSMAPEDFWMGWFCSSGAFGELILQFCSYANHSGANLYSYSSSMLPSNPFNIYSLT